MPTASKVLFINGVNTGISYPTNTTKQPTTQTQSKMYSSDEPKTNGGVSPGQTFTTSADGQRVTLICQQTTKPGGKVRFQLPIPEEGSVALSPFEVVVPEGVKTGDSFQKVTMCPEGKGGDDSFLCIDHSRGGDKCIKHEEKKCKVECCKSICGKGSHHGKCSEHAMKPKEFELETFDNSSNKKGQPVTENDNATKASSSPVKLRAVHKENREQDSFVLIPKIEAKLTQMKRLKVDEEIDRNESNPPKSQASMYRKSSTTNQIQFSMTPQETRLITDIVQYNDTSMQSLKHPKVQEIIKTRKGRWVKEEEEYANFLSKEFSMGLADINEGTTKRSYLSNKLICTKMRISKKFQGMLFLFTNIEV